MKKNQPYRWMLAAVGVALSLSTNSIPAFAQSIPVHAQGLKEELITVDLSGSKKTGWCFFNQNRIGEAN